MQARCPHCRNVFTTDRSGVQFCPSCGQQVEVPEAPGAAPGGPVPPSSGPAIPPSGTSTGPGGLPPFGAPPPFTPVGEVPGDTPWERRAELGFLPAVWGTWKETMFRPIAFWRLVRPNGPFADALFYAWIITAIQTILSLPFRMLQMGAANPFQQLANNPDMPQQWRGFLEQMSGAHVGMASAVVQALFGLVFFPLILIVGAGILHLFCLMFSAGQNGFNATFRVLCYAVAPAVFGFFICLSPLVFVYEVVLAIFGIAAVHGTTGGRASAAVITPIGLSLAFFCVVPLVVIGGMIGAAGVH